MNAINVFCDEKGEEMSFFIPNLFEVGFYLRIELEA